MNQSSGIRSGSDQAWDVLTRVIPLQSNEYFLGAWTARFFDPIANPNALEGADGFYPEQGLLALTNLRLVFVAKRTDDEKVRASLQDLPMNRLVTKREEEMIDAVRRKSRFCIWESKSLEDIVSFSLSSAYMTKSVNLTVRWWHRGHSHGIEFSKLGKLDSFSNDYVYIYGMPKSADPEPADARQLRALLSEALADRREEVQKALKSRKDPVVVDFSTLRERLQEQGISLETIKCPSCGGAIQLPTAGAKKTCEYCGSHIYAMQVMPRRGGS